MDILNEYMVANREPRDETRDYGGRGQTRIVSAIECHDGFWISVQGHYGAYSSPRENDAEPYYKVECGFPSARVPELTQWKDHYQEDGGKTSDDSDMQSVYAYVPVEVVIALLESHGGIKGPHAWPAKEAT